MIYEDLERLTLDDDYLLHRAMDMSGEVGNLGREEERRLVLAAQSGDEKAMDKLVMSNLRYCLNVARLKVNQGSELLDLFNEAVMGLMRGIMMYDVDDKRGGRLLTYAGFWVKAFLYESLGRDGRAILLSRTQVNNFIKIKEVIDEAAFNNKKLRVADIVEATGIKHKTVMLLLGQWTGALCIDKATDSSGNEAPSILETYPVSRQDKWISDSETEWLKRLIKENLTWQEAVIIESYFWGNKTLTEIGKDKRIGVVGERVRQKKMKALAKLKVAIANHDEAAGIRQQDRLEMME